MRRLSPHTRHRTSETKQRLKRQLEVSGFVTNKAKLPIAGIYFLLAFHSDTWLEEEPPVEVLPEKQLMCVDNLQDFRYDIGSGLQLEAYFLSC